MARLWPGFMSTADMLLSLRRLFPDKLAAAWTFMHALPALLRPADLTAMLDWAVTTLTDDHGRDQTTLVIKILAWAVRSWDAQEAEHEPAGDHDVIVRLAEAIANLARSDYFHEPGMPLDELGAELSARPSLRRTIARKLLERASPAEVGYLTFGTGLCLFPPQDAAHWAAQLPSLTSEIAGNLGFPLQNAPDNLEEWGQVWELAQADALLQTMTQHWYALPVNHPAASDARRRRAAEERDLARRASRRYDEAALCERLAALTAGDARVRQTWLNVIVDLYRTADGDELAFDHSLDLSSAPSYPPPGSLVHDRLIDAAVAVLRNAPVITVEQINPARIDMAAVPELWALSLVTQSGHPCLGELEASRWAGLTLALIFVPTVPADRERRSQLLAVGLAHSGQDAEEALPALLDSLQPHQLARVVDGLLPAQTPGLAAPLRLWARTQDRDLGRRETVLDALAAGGATDILAELRGSVSPPGVQEDDVDPAAPAGEQWLSNAFILARRDTAVSMPAVAAAIAAVPAFARPFLERLAGDGLGEWPLDLNVLQTRDLAGLYELITAHSPSGDVPLSDESGRGLFGPAQQLARMRTQLARAIANRSNPESADQLRALADQYPDHWQLRELARQISREVAEQTWQPIEIADLLKLADNSALRLVRDEAQLSDVVTESIDRLQHLMTRPNGWVVLLWHKDRADAATGWWPVWEEDLSDLVATFLQHDLADHQVIVNREVQILRPGLDGRRTDIHVQAALPGTENDPEPLTVIIECKGCWRSDLNTALATQLVAKYLAMPGRHAGIYLVGYFDNTRWNHKLHPGREHTAHDLEEITAEQTRIAREQTAQEGVTVTAYTLNCCLPAPATTTSPK
jgi:hypothetical protein